MYQRAVFSVKPEDVRLFLARWQRKSVVQRLPVRWMLSRTLSTFFAMLLMQLVCSVEVGSIPVTAWLLH